MKFDAIKLFQAYKNANDANLFKTKLIRNKQSEAIALELTLSAQDFVRKFHPNLMATLANKKMPNSSINLATWGKANWGLFGFFNAANNDISQQNYQAQLAKASEADFQEVQAVTKKYKHKFPDLKLTPYATFDNVSEAIMRATKNYAVISRDNMTIIDIDDDEDILTEADLLSLSKSYFNGQPLVYQRTSNGTKIHIFIDASANPFYTLTKNFRVMVNGKMIKADIRAKGGYCKIASTIKNKYSDFKFLIGVDKINLNALATSIDIDTYEQVALHNSVEGLLKLQKMDWLKLLPQLPTNNDNLVNENDMCLDINNHQHRSTKGYNVKSIRKLQGQNKNKSIQRCWKKDQAEVIVPETDGFTCLVNLTHVYRLQKLQLTYQEGNRNNFFYIFLKYGLVKCGLFNNQSEYRRFVDKMQVLNKNTKTVEPLPSSELKLIADKLWYDAKKGYLKGLTHAQFEELSAGTGLLVLPPKLEVSPIEHYATTKEIIDKYGDYYTGIHVDLLNRPYVIDTIDGVSYKRFAQKRPIDKKTCNMNESLNMLIDNFKAPINLYSIRIDTLKRNVEKNRIHNNFADNLDNVFLGNKDVQTLKKYRSKKNKMNTQYNFYKQASSNYKHFYQKELQLSRLEQVNNSGMVTTNPKIVDQPDFVNHEQASYTSFNDIQDYQNLLNIMRYRQGMFKKPIKHTQAFNILTEYKNIRNKLYPHNSSDLEYLITLAAVIKQKYDSKHFEQKDSLIMQIKSIVEDTLKAQALANQGTNNGFINADQIVVKRQTELFGHRLPDTKYRMSGNVLTEKEAYDLQYLRIETIMDMYQFGFEKAYCKLYDRNYLPKNSFFKLAPGNHKAIYEFVQQRALIEILFDYAANLRDQLKIKADRMIDKVSALKQKKANQTITFKEKQLTQDVINQCIYINCLFDEAIELINNHDWLLAKAPEPIMVEERKVVRYFSKDDYKFGEDDCFETKVKQFLRPARNYEDLSAEQLKEFGLAKKRKPAHKQSQFA